MNSTPLPTEFHWTTEGAANAAYGEGLAYKQIEIVKGVDLTYTFYGRAPWLWKNMICCERKTD